MSNEPDIAILVATDHDTRRHATIALEDSGWTVIPHTDAASPDYLDALLTVFADGWTKNMECLTLYTRLRELDVPVMQIDRDGYLRPIKDKK